MIALGKAARIFGLWTMVSRLTGFFRDMLIAHFLGAGIASEAFIIAFRLPNLLRRLFAEGALNAALVPLYGRIAHEQGDDQAKQFASEALSILGLVLLLICGLAMIFMHPLTYGLAPGFADRPQLLDLAARLGLISFPYLGLMVIASFLGGLLNSLGRFWAVAAAPILLNLAMIGMIFIGLLWPLDEDRSLSIAYGLAWGVSLAGIAQVVLIAWQAHRHGLLPRLGLPRRFSPEVKSLFALMGPGVIAGGILQINVVVGTQIASSLDEGAVAYLYYADRLTQLPLGVIGVSMGVVLLPLLGQHIRQKNDEARIASYNNALWQAMLTTLPAMTGLIGLAFPIVDILFRHGAFGLAQAKMTSYVTIAMSLAIPGMITAKISSAAFFANEDTKSPLRFALISVVINIILSLCLAPWLGVIGIALASSLAALINASQQIWRLHHHYHYPLLKDSCQKLILISLASVLMMGLAYGSFHGLSWFNDYLVKNVLNLTSQHDKLAIVIPCTLAIIIAAGFYFWLVVRLKIITAQELKEIFRLSAPPKSLRPNP